MYRGPVALADFEVIPILTYLILTTHWSPHLTTPVPQKNLASNNLDENDLKIRQNDGTPTVVH